MDDLLKRDFEAFVDYNWQIVFSNNQLRIAFYQLQKYTVVVSYQLISSFFGIRERDKSLVGLHIKHHVVFRHFDAEQIQTSTCSWNRILTYYEEVCLFDCWAQEVASHKFDYLRSIHMRLVEKLDFQTTVRPT